MELQVVWNEMADMMDLPYSDLNATSATSPPPPTPTPTNGASRVDAKYWMSAASPRPDAGYNPRSPVDVKWHAEDAVSPRSNADGGKYRSPPPPPPPPPPPMPPGSQGGGEVDDDSAEDELYSWQDDGMKRTPSWGDHDAGGRGKAAWGQDAVGQERRMFAHTEPHRKRKFWEHHEDAVGDRKEARIERKHGAGSPSGRMSASWDLAENLAADLDGSLSGLGVDLSTASYNMSEALLALPSLSGLKQEAPSPTSLPPAPADNNHGVREADSNTGGGGFKEAVTFRAALQRHGSATSLHQLLQPGAGAGAGAGAAKTAAASSTTGAIHDLGVDCRFQYVLAAATSIATKVTEETLTYLNQGQSYEIKLKKLGELSAYRGRILKSVIRICFHERRLQYMEAEQMSAWRASRPGERIVEVDVPLSYGVCEVGQDPWLINTVDFLWDPTKEVGVYIKVNCISTEFTPKKHGGEKGVPFRIQVETYLQGDTGLARLHAAACQIKVFKLKGGDRKHKQDREKILKRPSSEHDKFQPSYDCTVLNDIPVELVFPAQSGSALVSSSSVQPAYSPPDNNRLCGGGGGGSGVLGAAGAAGLLEAGPGVADEEAGSHIAADQRSVHSQQDSPEMCVPMQLSCDSPAHQTGAWLSANRFAAFARVFGSFSGADLLRLTRDDLTQICGLADGIRLHNALHARCVTPTRTVYVSVDGGGGAEPSYRALYLTALSAGALRAALAAALGLAPARLVELHVVGPAGIRVLVTDDVVAHLRDDAVFSLQLGPDASGERFQVLLKPAVHQ